MKKFTQLLNHLKIFVTISASILLLLPMSQCNDRPTGIGADLLLDTVEIFLLSSENVPLFTSMKTVTTPLSLFNSGYLYIGASQSAIAYTLLTPTIIPQLSDSVTAEKIISAKLILFPRNLALGDTIVNFLRFTVHEMPVVWSPGTTIDTIRAFERDGKFPGQQIAEFSGTLPFGDTVDPIAIPIPKELVLQWIKQSRDTNTQTFSPYGIALIPDTNQSTLIRAFYTQKPGFTELPLSYYEVVIQRADSLDTVKIENGYDLSVLFPRSSPPEGRMFIQGGIAQRVFLQIDRSLLPPLSIIHRAELILPYDPALSEYTTATDPVQLAVYNASDSIQPNFSAPYPVGLSQFVADSSVFLFPDISQAFRERNNRTSIPILITAGDEYGRIDRIACYSIQSKERKPLLRLIYSVIREKEGQ